MRGRGIAFAGTIVHDKIYNVTYYPPVGSLCRIGDIQNAVGGLVPNDAIDMKKLCPTVPVYALGRVGDDESGKFCLSSMQGVGVDTSRLKVSGDSVTGFTDVMSIPGGQRTFFTHSGANDEFCYDDIPWDSLDVDMLHLRYFLLLEKIDTGDGLRILQEAKRRGILTSVDFVSESPERYSAVVNILPFVDNLIINEQEAAALCGMNPTADSLESIAERLSGLGVRERVIIHSPELGVIYNKGKVTRLPSYKLPDGFIVGTAGAGDAFCTGALLGIYEGCSDEQILELATLCATASLRSADATGAIESLDVLKERFSHLPRREATLTR